MKIIYHTNFVEFNDKTTKGLNKCYYRSLEHWENIRKGIFKEGICQDEDIFNKYVKQ